VKRSGTLEFRQQKLGDQQAAKTEKDVHAEVAIAPNAHLVGGLGLVQALAQMALHDRGDRNRTLAVQRRNTLHLPTIDCQRGVR
jgi:hypothetical protein